MKKTTIKKLIKNKCYCKKRDKDISLMKCDWDCRYFDSCRKRTASQVDKDLQKQRKK
jgi:hypothetical protein